MGYGAGDISWDIGAGGWCNVDTPNFMGGSQKSTSDLVAPPW